MKAIVYSEYGPPEVLRVEQRPIPKPAADEILVRVMATEVTKADCELRSFNFPVKWFSLALRLALGWRRPRRTILGAYTAGVVEAVGTGVKRFAVGDAVFGSTRMRFGAYGEYVTLPQSFSLAKKPASISFEEAAASLLGGLNALHFMTIARIAPGERILINGAGGSIGLFGVQIAKSFGATVTAVDAGHKEALVREAGADEFIDYQLQDFGELDQKFDVIFDMVAGSSYSKCLSMLAPRGRYLTGNPTFEKMYKSVFTSWFTDKKSHFAFANETQQELETLAEMLAKEQIRTRVDRVFLPEQIGEAHHRVESEQRLGGVVLSLAPPGS